VKPTILFTPDGPKRLVGDLMLAAACRTKSSFENFAMTGPGSRFCLCSVWPKTTRCWCSVCGPKRGFATSRPSVCCRSSFSVQYGGQRRWYRRVGVSVAVEQRFLRLMSWYLPRTVLRAVNRLRAVQGCNLGVKMYNPSATADCETFTAQGRALRRRT
jgi:hypothetical protein